MTSTFRQLFDPESSTYSYLLADADSREAVLIDPVRGRLDRDLALIRELDLRLKYTLETHVHADHVTSSGVLRQLTGSQSVLSRNAQTGCNDVSVAHGDILSFGKRRLRVLETPGHTDSCISYYDAEEQRVFTGDALLIRGCGRTDFQQGDARKLFVSITQQLFSLPPSTLVYPGHDYAGHTVSTIAEEQRYNPRLAGKTEAQFVTLMNELRLAPPKQITEAVPANLACGLPVDHAQGANSPAWAPVERVDGVPEVTADWLRVGRPDVRVVDVREASEYVGDLGHIPESELVPLPQLTQHAATWNRERPIVVVCRSGRRSGEAAKLLEQLGFQRVASLRGGMANWRHTETKAVVGGKTVAA